MRCPRLRCRSVAGPGLACSSPDPLALGLPVPYFTWAPNPELFCTEGAEGWETGRARMGRCLRANAGMMYYPVPGGRRRSLPHSAWSHPRLMLTGTRQTQTARGAPGWPWAKPPSFWGFITARQPSSRAPWPPCLDRAWVPRAADVARAVWPKRPAVGRGCLMPCRPHCLA